MHPTYVALNEATLYTGACLNGVHRTCAKTASVPHGTSHAVTRECCQYTTSVDTKNMHYEVMQPLSESHPTWAQLICSRAEHSAIKARNNNSNGCCLHNMRSVWRWTLVEFIFKFQAPCCFAELCVTLWTHLSNLAMFVKMQRSLVKVHGQAERVYVLFLLKVQKEKINKPCTYSLLHNILHPLYNY